MAAGLYGVHGLGLGHCLVLLKHKEKEKLEEEEEEEEGKELILETWRWIQGSKGWILHLKVRILGNFKSFICCGLRFLRYGLGFSSLGLCFWPMGLSC